MGWIFSHYTSVDDQINDLKLNLNTGHSLLEDARCNFYSNRGITVSWMLIHTPSGTFIECHLLTLHEGRWGYKTLHETDQPLYHSCPLHFLDKANQGVSEEWRQVVRAFHGESTTTPTTNLDQLKELPDLSVDACVVDQVTGQLIFLSVWGRDTAITELIARLTLDARETESLRSGITLNVDGKPQRISINADLLEKQLSRSYKGTLFGNLINLWLFDNRCTSPDRANLTSYVLLEQNTAMGSLKQHPQFTKCLAQLTDLSPLPILPSWADLVFQEAEGLGMVTQHKTLLGSLTCFQIALDLCVLERSMSALISSQQLRLPTLNHAH